MKKNNLSGIERELVLNYLSEKKTDIIFSIENENAVDKIIFNQNQFLVADKKILLLTDFPYSLTNYKDKTVRIQFYFNKLGLYFLSKIEFVSSGCALVIPQSIQKIEEETENSSEVFSVLIKSMNIYCLFDENFNIFHESDFKNSVNTYLTQSKNISNLNSVENRIYSPSVIFIDQKNIVFASLKKNMPLKMDCEYELVINFPLEGPVKKRSVIVKCLIKDLYEDFTRTKLCAVAQFVSIQEEDLRFISEKVSFF
ncbi:hypothetical protein [Treponema sp.]|uniref:hypothetical protein n=1 Tax=Treponema sp. TaxID=166 RepID=UPI00388FCF78